MPWPNPDLKSTFVWIIFMVNISFWRNDWSFNGTRTNIVWTNVTFIVKSDWAIVSLTGLMNKGL